MRDELQINVHGVVDGRPVRRCPHCKELKDLNDFGLRRLKGAGQNGADVVANQPWCRDCRNEKEE